MERAAKAMELNINVKLAKKDSFEDEEEEEETSFPVSPVAQYFSSSVLSVGIMAVLETETPIDDSNPLALLKELFLPINPRFSSVMVKDKNGEKRWKKVEVNLKDHLHVPIFPKGKTKEFYTDCFNEYMTKISMEQLPHSRPLWDIHLIKYPTNNAAGTIVFKLHHALGDGYSLMGALLSCLKRADDPSLPLTLPAFNRNPDSRSNKSTFGLWNSVPQLLYGIVNSLTDFGWSLLKSTSFGDGRTSIRSGDDGVEFRHIDITTITFSFDQVKQIKTNLDVTINDVMCGVIFLGVRVYMKEMKEVMYDQRDANCTALVLFNTRDIAGYRSVDEMLKPRDDCKWGNSFAFLHVSIPKFTESSNNLSFVFKAQQVIHRMKNSASVVLTGKLLDTLKKYKGSEVTSNYVRGTLMNSSLIISNMVGPTEKMCVDNHPVKGLYFMAVGVPQSLTITITSYMGKIRVAVGSEKGFIDSQKMKSCIENAFDMVFKDAVPPAASSTPAN